MPITRHILILAALTLGVNAQTILVTTNNALDLNPERDAISALEGTIRIRHTITDGSEVLDVSAGFPIPLTIASRVDGYTNSIINTVTNDGVGVVWWVIPSLGTGEYELKSTVTLPDDSFPIYDRYLSVTSAPSAAGDIYITNNVSVGDTSVTNIFESGAFNISVTNIYNTGVETINSVDGNLTFEGSAVTQTGTTFNFSYVDTDTDDGFTNIATEGSGNVVTNLLYGGRVITQQLGTVSGGGGGGLDYWGSSNTTDATYLYPTGAEYTAQIVIDTNNIIDLQSLGGVLISGTTPQITQPAYRSVVIGGQGNHINGAGQYRQVIVGGRDNEMKAGREAVMVGGFNNEYSASGGTQTRAIGSVMVGGNGNTLTSGSGQNVSIFGGQSSTISGGDHNTIYSSLSSTISSANDYNTILGAQAATIDLNAYNSVVIGGDQGKISGGYYGAIIANSYELSTIKGGNNDNFGGNVILGGMGGNSITGSLVNSAIIIGGYKNSVGDRHGIIIGGGRYNKINSGVNALADGSMILQSMYTTNNAPATLSVGYSIDNNHEGSFVFRTYDGDVANRFVSAKTNTVLFKTGGFGINTNDPQADLHVAGEIRSDAGYIFPDGTTQTTASVSGGGGGLDHWASSNTTDATYLYPTGATHRQDYPYIVAFSNNGVSIGGVVPPTITSIGSVRVGGSGGTLSGSSSGALIAGGRDSSITGVGAQATIVGGRNHSITAGDEWTTILGGYENTLGGGRFGGTILGGRSASLTDGGSGCTIVGGYINSINTANGDYETVVGGYANSITSANDYNTVIGNQGCNITAGSWATIIGGYDADSTANYTFTSGYEINNTHAGTYMFRTYDGDATEWGSARTNSFIIKTGGVGINTNNPQADLHVNGMVQIDSVKVYASGTNLYLTDGSTFTNLITTTPL